MDLSLISFSVQIISHCAYMPAFMFLVISRYTFGLCLLSAIMNNAAMNIHVQIFVCTYAWLCAREDNCWLVHQLEVSEELLDFSTVASPFYIPSSSVEGFWLLIPQFLLRGFY